MRQIIVGLWDRSRYNAGRGTLSSWWQWRPASRWGHLPQRADVSAGEDAENLVAPGNWAGETSDRTITLRAEIPPNCDYWLVPRCNLLLHWTLDTEEVVKAMCVRPTPRFPLSEESDDQDDDAEHEGGGDGDDV